MERDDNRREKWNDGKLEREEIMVWVKTREKLPDKDEIYLTYSGLCSEISRPYYDILYWDNNEKKWKTQNGYHSYDPSEVDYWMSFPAIPHEYWKTIYFLQTGERR